jgi:hypothetical protein
MLSSEASRSFNFFGKVDKVESKHQKLIRNSKGMRTIDKDFDKEFERNIQII